jgi:hypothetical protein
MSKFWEMIEKSQKDPLMLAIERGNPTCAVLLVQEGQHPVKLAHWNRAKELKMKSVVSLL